MKKIKRTLIHFLIAALVIGNVALLPVDVLAGDYGVGGEIKVVATAAGSGGTDVSQVNLAENWTGLLFNSQLVYDSAKVEISNMTYSLNYDYQGSFQILQNGQVSVAKPFNYENPPSGGVEVTVRCKFHFKLTNGYGGDVSESKTVTVNLQNVDEYPVPQNKTYNLDEDSILNIDAPGFLSGVVDPEGDTVTAAISGSCSKGTANVNSDGSFTYTPNPNLFGADSFMYQIYTNGNWTGKTGTISLNIAGLPDPPGTTADTVVCSEDAEMDIDVLFNDYDPDNFNQPTIVDPIAITSVTPSEKGGTTTITEQGKKIHYKPKKDFFGTDKFTYTISDSTGRTASGTATITVNSVNDPPVAVADTAECDEDSFVVVDVLANDTDVEGDTLSLSIQGSPIQCKGEIVSGKLKCTPTANFFGTCDFPYYVSDGKVTSQGTLTITVKGIQDAPVAVNDSSSCNEDQEIDIDVLGNDSDADNDTVVITNVTPGGLGSVTITADKKKVHYIPKNEYSGVDSFTYAISDGHGGTATATVNLTIYSVNDPPIAVADTAECDEESFVEVDVLANDTDIENGALSLVSVGIPAHGSAAIVNEKIKYTPNSNYIGTDSCTYQISDGTNTNQGTLTINVKNIQDPPVAANDSYTINEDQVNDFDVLKNDADPDNDNLIITSVTQSSNGAVTITADKKKIHYIPKQEYSGSDSFTYTISDGQGGTAAATVNLTINAVNDLPVPAAETFTCLEDSSNNIFDVLANDIDPEGQPLKIDSNYSNLDGRSFPIQDNKLLYTPKPNYFGTESVVYMISDGNSSISSTLTVHITNVPDIPTAADDSTSCDEDKPVWINVLSNDKDLDNDPLTISVTSSPKNGTATVSGSGINYTPKQNWHGTDNLEYTINDGNGGTAAAIVTITVNDIYDLPVAQEDSYSVNMNNGLTVSALGVLKNDSGVEGPLTAELVETVKHGKLNFNKDGSFTYQPEDKWIGEDSFTYKANDGKEYSNIAKVHIDVKKPESNPGSGGSSSGSSSGGGGALAPVPNDPNEMGIPVKELLATAGKVVEIKTQYATLRIPSHVLTSEMAGNAKLATIVVSKADTSKFTSELISQIGNRPVIDLVLKLDGKIIQWNNPDAPVRVEIPYKPTLDELKDPEHITVWYIDGSGKAVSVPSGRYDAKTGKVTFTTTHFSKYAVVYVKKKFTDLEGAGWAKKQIEVLASKGIMGGRTENKFVPKVGITRAEYIMALVRTLGVTAKTDSCFNDVAVGSKYYEEIAIAKKLGISNGAGNNCFRPEDTITRQDMLVLTERALRNLKKLDSTGTAEDLARFTDRTEVRDYATASIATLVKTGLIEGSDGRLNVGTNTTRAEAAVFLYRISNR